VLGALGDGGAITASTPELDARVRQLRYMGQKVKFDHEVLGYQERLDELQAAFLRVKLRYLDEQVAARRRVATRYRELLGGTPLTLPAHDAAGRHAYYMYPVLAPERDALAAHLTERGIGTMVIYPRLVTQAGAYASLPWRSLPIPVAESLPGRLLCLPMFAELTSDEVDRVGTAVNEFYGAA
jgi:dTDP-4-amino-4,6-dideoxygalactose transaminase